MSDGLKNLRAKNKDYLGVCRCEECFLRRGNLRFLSIGRVAVRFDAVCRCEECFLRRGNLSISVGADPCVCPNIGGKMDKEQQSGSVKIENEVLGTIAAAVARKVPGVYKIVTSFVGGIAQLIRKIPDAGIKVVLGEGEVSFELRIIVAYGANIPEVTYQVQKTIKEEVENISGLKVPKVDVIVSGVHFQKQETEQKDERDVSTEDE